MVHGTAYQPGPLRNWVRWHAKGVVIGVLCAVVSAGVYYAATQINPVIHAAWHRLVPNSTLRHGMRGAFEGFFFRAGMQSQLYSPARPSFWQRHVVAHLDRWMERRGVFPAPGQPLTLKQKALALPYSVVFMIAGAALVYGLARGAVSVLELSGAWSHIPGFLQDLWVPRALGYGTHLGLYPTARWREQRRQRRQDKLRPLADAGHLTDDWWWLPGGRARHVAITLAAARRRLAEQQTVVS